MPPEPPEPLSYGTDKTPRRRWLLRALIAVFAALLLLSILIPPERIDATIQHFAQWHAGEQDRNP